MGYSTRKFSSGYEVLVYFFHKVPPSRIVVITTSVDELSFSGSSHQPNLNNYASICPGIARKRPKLWQIDIFFWNFCWCSSLLPYWSKILHLSTNMFFNILFIDYMDTSGVWVPINGGAVCRRLGQSTENICRQSKFLQQATIWCRYSRLESGGSQIWITNIDCDGLAKRLKPCRRLVWYSSIGVKTGYRIDESIDAFSFGAIVGFELCDRSAI